MYFFEVKVNYTRQMGTDNPGHVKETYLVEANTPKECQERIIEELKPFVFGEELEVDSIKKKNLYDIYTSPCNSDIWFAAKVEMIIVTDEGSEKRKPVNILIQEGDIVSATSTLNKKLASIDSEVIGVAKSPILEIYREIHLKATL